MVAALACPVATLAQNAVDMGQEPDHTLLIENEYLRAFRVEIPRLQSTLVHRHDHDYVIITLTDSRMKAAKPGEAPITFTRYAGDIRYIYGPFAHSVTNDEVTPYADVTVEIYKGDTSRYNGYLSTDTFKNILGPGIDTNASYAVTLDKSGVKIWNVQLLAGDSQSRVEHQSGGQLIVAVNHVKLKWDSPEVNLSLDPGEVKWIPRGSSYKVANTGREPARFVILEMR